MQCEVIEAEISANHLEVDEEVEVKVGVGVGCGCGCEVTVGWWRWVRSGADEL